MTLCRNIKFDRESMMIAMEMVIHKYVDGAADNTGADLVIIQIIHMMTESVKFFIFIFRCPLADPGNIAKC